MRKTVLDDLPDEVLQLCLARLSLTGIVMAKNVCKRWHKLSVTYRLFKLRKILGLTEHCIFSLCNKYEKSLYRGLQVCLLGVIATKIGKDDHRAAGDELGDARDPMQAFVDYGFWQLRGPCSLLEGPQRLQYGATASPDGALLYILGGRSPLISRKPGSWMVFSRVDVYDPPLNRWYQTKPMKCGRYACSVGSYVEISKGMNLPRIIVAGGYDMDGYALSSAEIYDHVLDEWESIPSMQRISGACRGFGFGGKFFVEMANNGSNSSEVYNPLAKTWSTVSNEEMTHHGLHNFNISCNIVVLNL